MIYFYEIGYSDWESYPTYVLCHTNLYTQVQFEDILCECYYESNKIEAYYAKLPDFILKSGETKAINFDNKSGDGHYGVNVNSIYFTSSNAKVFEVMVSTQGFKPVTEKVNKDAGGEGMAE
jgi:hypothetical protein